MKKLFLSAIVVFVATAFTSCKKDYTCECKFSQGTPDINIPIEDAKKADAQDACDQAETTYKIADANANCTLK